MQRYIANAFSLQMLKDIPRDLRVTSVALSEVKRAIEEGVQWAIGHMDTARMAAHQLGVSDELPFQRRNICLESGDVLYVLQVVGGRLPEGCTKLPPGIELKWLKVE